MPIPLLLLMMSVEAGTGIAPCHSSRRRIQTLPFCYANAQRVQ